MNSSEKAANEKIIQSMQKKINYMKNPRYRINRPPVSFQQVKIWLKKVENIE